MKKILLTITIFTATMGYAFAQLLPSVQFGLKGGLNLSSISSSTSATFNSSNQAGYFGGVWARFGALGFIFQPEMYLNAKNVQLTSPSPNEVVTSAKFTSLDVPLLVGAKFGAFGFGARFYTGPVVSFSLNKNQTYSQAASDAFALQYHDQNYAWQAGVGVDIKKISVDLRYEAGLNKQAYTGIPTRVNLFNLSLAYSLLKF